MRDLTVTYSKLKSLQVATSLAWCYQDDVTGNTYTIFLVDIKRDCLFMLVMPKANPAPDGSDQLDFETNIKSGATAYNGLDDGIADQILLTLIPSPMTASGMKIVATDKTDDAKRNFITHDWTDKTTWYTNSTYVVNEVASDSGDHTTYNLAHPFVIDSYHGNLTDEDLLKDANGHSYRVAVGVLVHGTGSPVSKAEQDPHAGTGGDFMMDYVAGKTIFQAPLNGDDVVQVTYHYAGSSLFTVKPDAGKILSLCLVEVQLSDDVGMLDSARFQAYGYVQSFAPQYLIANGGPYAPNTLIPIGAPAVYKSISDFLNMSTRAFPAYPAIGGAGWRGMQRPTYVFDWDYLAKTPIESLKGMEIRITLDHDKPWTGDFATASFYCTQK